MRLNHCNIGKYIDQNQLLLIHSCRQESHGVHFTCEYEPLPAFHCNTFKDNNQNME